MLISDSKKFIFFHLYKTAGTSLSEVLKPHVKPHHHKHFKVCDYLKGNYMDTRYKDYFTFGFVRNPWDWQVSLYHYMLMDHGHFQHNLVKSFKDYSEYVDWRVHEDCKPQYTFFSEKGDLDSPITLDYIGKFEKLSEEVNYVKNRLGLEINDLPHLVKSNRQPYQTYYDKKTRDMIGQAYHKDVETFNYAF